MQILRTGIWAHRVGVEGRKRVGALLCWGIKIFHDSDELPDEKVGDVVQVGSRLCAQEAVGDQPQSWFCETTQAIRDEVKVWKQSIIPIKDGEFDVKDPETAIQKIIFNKTKWKLIYGKVQPHPRQERQLTQKHL